MNVRRLWDRSLDHYPDTAQRYAYLAIVVLGAIVLYYEFYVQASVTPSIVARYHMTWPFFVYVVVVGNLVGAFASLIAGLSDRWGRANLVTYGLLVTGLVVLFGMPNAPNLWVYATLYGVLGFAEGIILVATPALIRDFSPQLGRGSAMGFWTHGTGGGQPHGCGGLSHTLSHLHAWQDQFLICGVVGMVVFVVALVGLRELSPGLRDQLMVSVRDRQLIEARAAGIDVEESLKHPWRQVLHADIVGSSLGIGVFLIAYYTLIAFLVVYMSTIFGYTQQRANALGNWVWVFDAVALVVVGVVSDKVRVRKPFIAVGAIGTIVATLLLAARTTHPGTGYYSFVWILSLLAVCLGLGFGPWLAAFTETVEGSQPRPDSHRPGGVGLGAADRRGRFAVRPALRRHVHDTARRTGGAGPGAGGEVRPPGPDSECGRPGHGGPARSQSGRRGGHRPGGDRDLPGAEGDAERRRSSGSWRSAGSPRRISATSPPTGPRSSGRRRRLPRSGSDGGGCVRELSSSWSPPPSS